jgi:hypothetical protein
MLPDPDQQHVMAKANPTGGRYTSAGRSPRYRLYRRRARNCYDASVPKTAKRKGGGMRFTTLAMILVMLTCCGCKRMGNPERWMASDPDLQHLHRRWRISTIPSDPTYIGFRYAESIDDAGLAEAAKYLKHYGVRELDLSRQNVSDASIPTILSIPSIRTLHLQHTPVTESGLLQLRSHRHLDTIYIEHTKFTSEQLASVRTRLVGMTVDLDHSPSQRRKLPHSAPQTLPSTRSALPPGQ